MNKIEALKQTICNLENDVYEYSWSSLDSCNCGIVARTLLNGESPLRCGVFDSKSVNLEDGGIFSKYAHCLKTNLPLPKVFRVLKSAGFTYEELLELEFLGNVEISKRLNYSVVFTDGHMERGDFLFDVKTNLLAYLKEWVKILEAEQPVPEVKTRTVYVSVPTTIVSQAKECILS